VRGTTKLTKHRTRTIEVRDQGSIGLPNVEAGAPSQQCPGCPHFVKQVSSFLIRLATYCRAIATMNRSSAPIMWSTSLAAASISICTHLTFPLNSFPREP